MKIKDETYVADGRLDDGGVVGVGDQRDGLLCISTDIDTLWFTGFLTRACLPTWASRALSSETSREMAVAFLMPSENFLAFSRVRQAVEAVGSTRYFRGSNVHLPTVTYPMSAWSDAARAAIRTLKPDSLRISAVGRATGAQIRTKPFSRRNHNSPKPEPSSRMDWLEPVTGGIASILGIIEASDVPAAVA